MDDKHNEIQCHCRLLLLIQHGLCGYRLQLLKTFKLALYCILFYIIFPLNVSYLAYSIAKFLYCVIFDVSATLHFIVYQLGLASAFHAECYK